MTLIALLHKDSFPMAITDNLISNEKPFQDKTPITPLDTEEIINSGKKEDNFYIWGMANKIWKKEIDGKYFFLLYSGTVTKAENIFNRFINNMCYEVDNKESKINNILENLINEITSDLSSDVSGIFIYYDNGRINSKAFQIIENVSSSDKNINFSHIAQVGGSGAKSFSELLIRYYKNNLPYSQKEYFQFTEKNSKDQLWEIFHPDITKANIYNRLFFEQCFLMSLSLLAICTTETLRKQERSELVKNACGGLYNLHHFVELYPNNNRVRSSDTGLCQIFIERVGDKKYIKKFILTNYIDNKTISFVLNNKIDITYLNININNLSGFEKELFIIDKNSFNVFEINNLRKDSTSRKILNDDIQLMKANQLIVYEYQHGDYEHVKFMPFANRNLSSMKKLVNLTVNGNYIKALLDLCNEP